MGRADCLRVGGGAVAAGVGSGGAFDAGRRRAAGRCSGGGGAGAVEAGCRSTALPADVCARCRGGGDPHGRVRAAAIAARRGGRAAWLLADAAGYGPGGVLGAQYSVLSTQYSVLGTPDADAGMG